MSIEWLIDQLEQKGDMRETPSIRNLQLNIDTSDYLELKRQAKEMHKQEIISAYAFGHNDGCRYMTNEKQEFEHGEGYYQETFVSKGSDECQTFEKMYDTTSATLCANCGKEKFLHKI
jgi:hypothetical protein